ncbi:MAG TPA: hypothetical protein VL242_50465 [Sorangium sp.]|nr:hypothetical protein [Sorangium sp.]
MKFLVFLNEKASRPETDWAALNRSIREHVSRMLEDGTLDCAHYVLPNRGVCIMNASSHEVLLSQLRSWPAYSHHSFEIYPLCNIFQAIDDNFGRVPPPAGTAAGQQGGST